MKVDLSNLYFIQCTDYYAYNYILWWRLDCKGYTHDLSQAGLYTRDEAERIVNRRKGVDVAWPEADVRANVEQAVSIERLRNSAVQCGVLNKLKGTST